MIVQGSPGARRAVLVTIAHPILHHALKSALLDIIVPLEQGTSSTTLVLKDILTTRQEGRT